MRYLRDFDDSLAANIVGSVADQQAGASWCDGNKMFFDAAPLARPTVVEIDIRGARNVEVAARDDGRRQAIVGEQPA